MDQNSSNGAGNGKASWRERLRIGTNKDMPRLSDEFDAPETSAPAPARAAPAAAPRPSQPVARPAPMAPRPAAKAPAASAPAVRPAAAAPSRATPQAPAAAKPAAVAPPQVTPAARLPGSEPSATDSLAEKLKAQRAAAERLAQQRVSAARERAEGRGSEPTIVPTQASAPAPRPPQPAPAAKPKFSFADEEPGSRPEPAAFAPEPSPPRPAAQPNPSLGMPKPTPAPARPPFAGGDRVGPSLLRPQQPSYRPEPPPYRPIDPATGYPAAPRAASLGSPRPADPGYLQGRAPARPNAYDSYRRAAEAAPQQPPLEAEAPFEGQRTEPRLGRPAPTPAVSTRSRARQPEPLQDEIFEDEAPPPRKRRASAMDYQAAQREADYTEEEDHRRSMGPWLLLAIVLAAGLLTGGGVWYYSTHIKPGAGTVSTSSATTQGTGQPASGVPVVEPPSQPAKTTPETTTQQGGGQSAAPAAASKKQIYDRIVGDQEVPGNKVQPTEVTPVQPDTQDQGAGQAAQPAGAAPAGSTDSGSDAAAPLPLPPPPGDTTGKTGTQGSLTPTTDQTVASAVPQPSSPTTTTPIPATGDTAAADVVPAAAEPPKTTESAADTTQASPLSPLKPATPKPTAEQAAATTGTIGEVDPQAASNDTAAADAKPAAEATASPAKPVSKKTATVATNKSVLKKKPVSQSADTGSVKPLVLVPPSQGAITDTSLDQGDSASPSQGGGQLAAVPVSPAAPAPQAVTHKKTIFDLFKGASASNDTAAPQATETAEPVPQPAPTKLAALPAPKTSTAAPSGGSGYVVQLASFPSQAEAQSEYSRLRSKYPSVVGSLAPRISPASFGGSTRYQLGLGPVSSRDQATQVCSSLFASGERDCLVRKQ